MFFLDFDLLVKYVNVSHICNFLLTVVFFFSILFIIFFLINLNNIINLIFTLILLFVVISSLILFIFKLEFLAFIYLIVYVGAIAVLFLFALILLDIKLVRNNSSSFSFLKTLMFLFIVTLQIIIYLSQVDSMDTNNIGFSLFNIYYNFIDVNSIGYFLYVEYFLVPILISILLLIVIFGVINLLLIDPIKKTQHLELQHIQKSDRYYLFKKN